MSCQCCKVMWPCAEYHCFDHVLVFLLSLLALHLGEWPQVVPGEIQIRCQEKLIPKSGQVLCQAAQGGGRVTVPGGVQETFICCTKECGLVGNIDGQQDWMILEIFSNLGDSVILRDLHFYFFSFIILSTFFSKTKQRNVNANNEVDGLPLHEVTKIE